MLPHRESPDSVAVRSLCHDDYFTVHLDTTAKAAIEKVRRSGKKGHIYYIYVVDDEERLCGVVSIRNLLAAEDEDSIRTIYSPKPVFLDEHAPVSEAYERFSKSRFLSLPVVDSRGRLVGALNAHELVEEFGRKQEDLFEERSRGALFELLGIKAEDASRSTSGVVFRRFPWLCLNVLSGALSAFFIHHFGSRLPRAVEFLAFVPVLLVISESIGMQSASMTIALLHRAPEKGAKNRLLAKELQVAMLLGLLCAALMAIPLYLIKGSLPLAVTVASTLFLGAVGVSLLGNAIPRLFHRLKVDPRVAAGPVVLSIADCSVLVLFLLIAISIAL